MDKQLFPYYVSRTAISIGIGILLYITGSQAWVAILLGGLLTALFLYAPQSGRYSVHPEFALTPLRRDEHTQFINDAAGRNAFVVIILLIGALIIGFGAGGTIAIPSLALKAVMAAGALTYFLSDFWMRRTSQQ